MLRTESNMVRNGELPKKGILYMKDYNFFMWGDRVFLTIMDFAIFYVLVQGWPLAANAVVISMFGAVIWASIWDATWMKPSHRPDSFYPWTGAVSLLGMIHLVYCGVQYALGFMGLWMVGYMVAGLRPWSLVAAVGLFAAAVYYVILAVEWRRGKFKRLPTHRG